MGSALPYRAVRGYAVSTFAKTLSWSGADAFSLFVLTDVLLIAPPLAGALVLGFMAAGAVSDLTAAAIVDGAGIGRHRPPWRFYLASAGLASIFFALTFLPLPAHWPAIVLAAGFGIGFRFTYALMDVPHNAMIGDLADRENPVRIAALRLLATIAGGMAVTTLGARMLTGAAGLPLRAAGYGAAVALTAFVLFVLFNPVRIVRRAAPVAPGATPSATRPLTPLIALFLLGEVCAAIISGLISKSVIYLATTGVAPPGWAAGAFTLMLLGKLISAGAWLGTPHRPPLALWSAFAFLGLAVTATVLVALRPTSIALDLALLLLGLGIGGVGQMGWGLMAELTRGITRRNLAFGLFTAVGKLGAGLSAVVLGVLLKPPAAGLGLYHGMLAAIVATGLVGALCLTLVHRLHRRP